MSNKPLQTWRNKGVDIAAWSTKNGGVSFTVKKTYKPKDGTQYIESKTFFPSDLRDLQALLSEAISWADKQDSSTLPPAVQAVVKPLVDDEIPF